MNNYIVTTWKFKKKCNENSKTVFFSTIQRVGIKNFILFSMIENDVFRCRCMRMSVRLMISRRKEYHYGTSHRHLHCNDDACEASSVQRRFLRNKKGWSATSWHPHTSTKCPNQTFEDQCGERMRESTSNAFSTFPSPCRGNQMKTETK